jgi:hypothetical protein
MTQQENSEPTQRSRYDRCDPHYLRELREAAGMDVVVLARTACLSVAQVKALESELSGEVFYSDTIKRQAYKRLLMILGAEPPTVDVPVAFRDAHQVSEAHLNTLDQIVAMSHQPPIYFSLADRVREGVSYLFERKQLMGAMLLMASALVLFVLYGPLQLVQESTPLNLGSLKPTPVVVPESALSPVSTSASQISTAPDVEPVASIPTAAPLISVASEPAAKSAVACAYSADVLPQLAPFVARKEGGYVYVVSSANTEVCVVDGNKQATMLQLKSGEGRTVTGSAPWQVSGSQLKNVQIYFQGGRVTLPDDTHRLKLVEQPVIR